MNELEGFGFVLDYFINAAAAWDDEYIAIFKIFMGVFVVNVGLDSKA